MKNESVTVGLEFPKEIQGKNTKVSTLVFLTTIKKQNFLLPLAVF